MLTDDSPLGRNELYCILGETFALFQRNKALLHEKLRGGNEKVSADAEFKDPIALRVRNRVLFGKYPLYQSVANVFLLLAIIVPF